MALMNMNISANVQFYVVTHVSHTNQIVYINSYSTHPYQAIISHQWKHDQQGRDETDQVSDNLWAHIFL